MAVLPQIFRRQDAPGLSQQQLASETNQKENYTPATSTLITVLVVLLLSILSLSGLVFYVRNRRRRLAALREEAATSGQYGRMGAFSNVMVQQQNMGLRTPATPSHHRRTKSLTTPPDSPVFVVGADSEKSIEAGAHHHQDRSARRSSVPEIHLTFPEELDEKSGKRESKVVVVTVSEKGSVGLRPLEEDPLPPYRERDDGMRSLDIERIGGLKEEKH